MQLQHDPRNENAPSTPMRPPQQLNSPVAIAPMGSNPTAATTTASNPRKRKASSIGGGGEEGELEMKRLAISQIHMPISELAHRVRTDETSENGSEKSRQLFGMTWLLKNCEVANDANVPRNRIYARYVGLCSEYNLKPLNPASFGKLVRVIYPGIKTRRLGVRGQSKYHYCGIRLIGSQNNPTGETPSGTPSRFGGSPDVINSSGGGGCWCCGRLFCTKSIE